MPKTTPFVEYAGGLVMAVFCFVVAAFLGLKVYPRGLAIGLAAVFFVMGVAGLVSFLKRHEYRDAFFHSQMTSRATILDRQVKQHKDEYEREWQTYWVVFRFDADEEQVTLRARVSKSFYEDLDPGTTLSVRYAATNPRVALLEGEDSS